MIERLRTVEEVAELFQIPIATIYSQRYRGHGLGTLAISVGRHLRFTEESLLTFIENQKRPEAVTRWTA